MQHAVIENTLVCLSIELLAWDLLLMPLGLTILTKGCKKRRGIFLHFRGLLV